MTNWRSSGLTLAVTACLACSESTAPAPVDAGLVDAGETPDVCTDEMACALTFDGTTNQAMGSDYVFPEGDSDAWEFDTTTGRVVNIVVANDVDFTPIRLEVVLFGPDGSAIVNQRFSGNGRQTVEIQRVIEMTGTHRVVVRDVGNDAVDRNNPYFITITELQESDGNEPNDDMTQAIPLTPGTAVSGAIGQQNDTDWFSITVAANQLIQIEMVAPGISDVRFRWTLFDPTGTIPIAVSDEPLGAEAAWPVENRAVGASAGTYFIRIEDNPDDGNDADLARIYQVTARLVTQPDVQELAGLNDTVAAATTLSSGQTATGYIGSTADFDYYRIQVTSAPQLIEVRASMAVSDVDLAFSIFGPDGETLICDERDGDLCRAFRFVTDGTEGAADLETAHVAMTNGTYYVLVRDLQDNEFDTTNPYQVTVNLPAEPDGGENYNLNGRGGSRTIVTSTAGITITYPWAEGYISHANDQDWFRFDIPGPIGAVPGQNGDWLVQIELQMPSPTPVELQAFFFGPEGSARERYRGYGQRCRDGSPNDPNPCQFPDEQNGIDVTLGEANGDCFVVFREVTEVGPHYFRMSDLDRDDYDLNSQYRLRVTLSAGCPAGSACEGRFTDNTGADLCGRP